MMVKNCEVNFFCLKKYEMTYENSKFIKKKIHKLNNVCGLC